MKEFAQYDMEDVIYMLKRRGIIWDGKFKDYISTGEDLLYTEVDATIETLKNGYLNEHIADKRFAWLEVTPYSFNYKYQGIDYDDTNVWMDYLSHKYPDYISHSKKHLDSCLSSLMDKLSHQTDKDSLVSTFIKNQMEEISEKFAIINKLSPKELNS